MSMSLICTMQSVNGIYLGTKGDAFQMLQYFQNTFPTKLH